MATAHSVAHMPMTMISEKVCVKCQVRDTHDPVRLDSWNLASSDASCQRLPAGCSEARDCSARSTDFREPNSAAAEP